MLATDIVSLSELGDPDPFREPWPVDERPFQEFANSSYQVFATAVASLGGVARDVLLSDVRMIDVLIQGYHAAAVTHSCHSRGVPLSVGPLSQSLFHPDWVGVGMAHESALARHNWPGAITLRSLKRIAAGNGHLGVAARSAALISGRWAWAIGTPGPLLSLWARDQGLLFRWPDPSHMRANPDIAVLANVREAAWACIAAIARIASQTLASTIDEAAAFRAWGHRLESLASLSTGVMRRRVPKAVAVAGAGNSVHRAMALACRRLGARVLTAQHGHNAGHLDADIICFNDYAISDTYICETKGAAEVAQRRSELVVIPPDRRVQFEWLASADIAKRWESRIRTTNVPIRTLMVMGFAHSARRSCTDLGYLWYARADLERRIIQQLKADGYRVIYKAHPEFASATAALFAPLVDEFIAVPFGQIRNQADAVVFTYPLTTAFAEAMLTEVPIVMFDLDGQKWSPHERVLLEQRMAMVPARVTGGAKIEFQAQALADAISCAPFLKGDGYVRTFMLPSSGAESGLVQPLPC